ncbi:MAG: DUF721 domain-containing protein [Bacteroidetes bacterium]|nr:DUF721 domain-containing protein [Bacteroidota bacterium]
MSTYSLAQALQLYLKESCVGDQIQAFQIKDAWETLVGKTIARYTDNIRLQGDKLFIHTQVGPLRNELQFQRSTIRQKVNDWLGSPIVREVIIQ